MALASKYLQSTIGGSLIGINGCKVIAMLTACHFLEEKIFIPQQLQDLKQVISLHSQLILRGNHIYSLCHVPMKQLNLELKEVLLYNNEEFQKIELIEGLGFFTVKDLESYLASYHCQHAMFAVVLQSLLKCPQFCVVHRKNGSERLTNTVARIEQSCTRSK